MGASDWSEEKNLVMHQLNEYKTNFSTLFKSVEDLKVQVAVLQTKVLFGAGIMSLIVSIAVGWLQTLLRSNAG